MRFDGYNRHDFNFPRTSRDAFGTDFYVDKRKSVMSVIWNFLAYTIIAVSLVVLFFGY